VGRATGETACLALSIRLASLSEASRREAHPEIALEEDEAGEERPISRSLFE
jgi:hypothetical protein